MIVSDKGFTLMEIMVSLAVLAIVLATLFKLQSSTVNLAEAGRFKSSAPVLARQVLALVTEENFDPNDKSGVFDDEYAGYSWECELQSAGDLGGLEAFLSDRLAGQLKQISVTVFSPGREHRFTLDTWRFAHVEQ